MIDRAQWNSPVVTIKEMKPFVLLSMSFLVLSDLFQKKLNFSNTQHFKCLSQCFPLKEN